MSDDQKHGLDFDSDNPDEQQLWHQLRQLPATEPSPQLRQRFYSKLEQASRPSLGERLRTLLGLNGIGGFATATACLVIGLAIGIASNKNVPSQSSDFAALQHQVASLERNLILDRLDSDSPNKRLQGVIEAARYVEKDPELARALLSRATQDKVLTVRSAAIDALGPELQSPAVGNELIGLLDGSQSPLVQFALVDLILRYGNRMQIEYLLQLSDTGVLDKSLTDYVKSAVKRNAA